MQSTLHFCDCAQWGGWGDLAVVGQGCLVHHHRLRPVQLHKQQPQASAVSSGGCLLVVVGSGMEPLLVDFLNVFLCAIFFTHQLSHNSGI